MFNIGKHNIICVERRRVRIDYADKLRCRFLTRLSLFAQVFSQLNGFFAELLNEPHKTQKTDNNENPKLCLGIGVTDFSRRRDWINIGNHMK